MAERLHLVIKGRVQGVGFRYAAYRQAQSLGLMGWVRNCADGTVEAEFDGNRSALESMIAWSKEGPQLARVTSVESTWSDADANHQDIEIR